MFDAHCHLTDDAFAGEVETALARARAAGVRGFVTIGANALQAEAACTLAAAQADVWCTAGIHPHEALSLHDDFARIVELLERPRVVAIGETGLDYHYDNSPRSVQRDAFERHVALAAETGLPVIVHTRDAEPDTAAMMLAAGNEVTGVLHCFTGTSRLLDVALDLDWFVSFAGIVTFRNYADADLVRHVPPDRLLIETDSPYLAPVPHRGQRNEPSFLPAICASVAAMRDIETEELATLTDRNTRAFYRIPGSQDND
ncbi:MAG: TatD family hydrolase [Longimicrobiales bacterium]